MRWENIILEIIIFSSACAVPVQARFDPFRGLFRNPDMNSTKIETENEPVSNTNLTSNVIAENESGERSNSWDWVSPGLGLVLLASFILITTLASYFYFLRSWERKREEEIKRNPNRALLVGLMNESLSESCEDMDRSVFENISLNSCDGPPPYDLAAEHFPRIL